MIKQSIKNSSKMGKKIIDFGIKQKDDIRILIERNNSLPYKDRDVNLSALYDFIVAYNSTASTKKVVNSSKDAYSCFLPYMMDLDHEEVWVMFLNKGKRVLKIERMFVGGLDSATVDNRLIVKEAIMMSAVGIIIAHNHPSGHVKPSGMDKTLTKKLKSVAEVCDITLLDHIIISGSKYYSISEEDGIL